MALPDMRPMLATLTDKPFDSPDWQFEIKHDGYRILAYIDNGTVRLHTRKGIDYTAKFPAIAEVLNKWKTQTIIDGEIVVLNEKGVSDFNALQNYRGGPVYYYVFDLLHYKGKDYTGEPLRRRQAMLKKILPKSQVLRFTDSVVGEGLAMFALAEQHGLEGLIAKRIDSVYRPGARTKDWLKIKVTKEAEFLIAGFTRQTVQSSISSLILADKNLQYAGDVGTGFNAKEIREILTRVKPLKKCPLKTTPVFGPGRWGKKAPVEVIWCRPVLRCLVRYLERTKDGELRHAAFVKLLK